MSTMKSTKLATIVEEPDEKASEGRDEDLGHSEARGRRGNTRGGQEVAGERPPDGEARQHAASLPDRGKKATDANAQKERA